MNETQKEALTKLEAHIVDHRKVLELTSFATTAALSYGPLNVIAITNRMNLWDYIRMRTGGYLSDREKRSLFYWFCQEPERLQEAKYNG